MNILLLTLSILISEIMYNPKENLPEYVELYNHSEEILSLSDLYFAVFDENNHRYKLYRMSSKFTDVFLPHHYAVVSKNPEQLQTHYDICPDAQMFIMPNMPTLKNGEGTVIVCKSDTSILDRVIYSDAMHYPLLSDTKGVSLERMSFEKLSDDLENWHSAAETLGFATPGCANSHSQNAVDDDKFSLFPRCISPNNDGIDDILTISYHFDDAVDLTGNIRIYNQRGILCKLLVNNEYLPASGIFFWDGFFDNGTRCPSDTYILIFDVLSISGKKIRLKKSFCVF
ncbi:hypothetical protein FACS1894178_6900 [Bacteroidia bacterium]|nr:hypothetical protein FACS1894178_6900 [Bacteroidia bacterium]